MDVTPPLLVANAFGRTEIQPSAGVVRFCLACSLREITYDILASGHFKCLIECFTKNGLVKGLRQAFHRASFKEPRTDRRICTSRNEHYRNFATSALKFLLQRRSRHAWHGNVEYQTFGSLQGVDPRKSSADENASTTKPKCRSKSGSDSRIDSSSSTTDTSGRSGSPLFIQISRQPY